MTMLIIQNTGVKNIKILPMAKGARMQGLRKQEAFLKNNLNPSSLLSCMFVLIHQTFFLQRTIDKSSQQLTIHHHDLFDITD